MLAVLLVTGVVAADNLSDTVIWVTLAAAVAYFDAKQPHGECVLDLALPPGATPEQLDALAARMYTAASLSAFAAPGRRPEVFLVADRDGTRRLRVVAWAGERAQIDRFRGDLLARADY